MRIQMESTDIFTQIEGTDVRVWNGVTEDGKQCFAFVACLAFRADQVLEEENAELREMKAPIFRDMLKPRL